MDSAAPLGPMPPHGIIADFLPEADHKALIEWTMSREAAFKPAKVFYGAGGHDERVDDGIRVSLRHRDLGPLEAAMRDRLHAKLPRIMDIAGYKGPSPRSIEFELNAYGDGAHFAPHIDIPVGANRRSIGENKGEDRVISALYYFYREPKKFSGGALRIYRFGVEPQTAGEQDSVAIEPLQNTLLIFPSWARHGVDPVRCSSDEFGDYRFALNCWFCRNISDDLRA